MNKAQFLEHGFHVVQRPNHLIVTTPQTFASGDPAHFFVSWQHDRVMFDDFGTSLNALELSLPEPEQAPEVIKRMLDKLSSPIEFVDFSLSYEVSNQQTSMAISEFVNLFAYLTTYRPKSHHEQQILLILERIERYLHHRFGTVSSDIKLKGLSGLDHRFRFGTDNHIFDFSEPKSQATGALLRKIHDVKAVNEELQFSIFMNDMENRRRFDKESRILSTVANIKPLSLLLAA